MSLEPWNKSMELGHPIIDGQHRRLYSLVLELNTALENNSAPGLISRYLQDLLECALTHFESEERIMDRARYPGLEQHKAIHADLLDKGQKIAQAYAAGGVLLNETLATFFAEWTLKHIQEEDRQAVEFIFNKKDS